MANECTPQVLPILEPEDVAEQVVRGILTEAEMVVLPWYTKYLIWIKAIVPVRGYQVNKHPTTKNAQFSTTSLLSRHFRRPWVSRTPWTTGSGGSERSSRSVFKSGRKVIRGFHFFKIFTLFARLAGCGIQVL